jgi:hypothetical protein
MLGTDRFSDPWWIFTTVALFYNIKSRYELTISQIIRISPRFAIMLVAMLLSIVFIVLDVLSVTKVLVSALTVGINPFWKLSFVCKCLTDAVVLDDFKTALDRLSAYKLSLIGCFAVSNSNRRSLPEHQIENPCEATTTSGAAPTMLSPDENCGPQPKCDFTEIGAIHLEHSKAAVGRTSSHGPHRGNNVIGFVDWLPASEIR